MSIRFPATRPRDANIPRPHDGEALHYTPPGFCWWRAAEHGRCFYRLRIQANGATVYTSPQLIDPVHVPEIALAAGHYTWLVEAVDLLDRSLDRTETRSFLVREGAHEQPWIEPSALLARVPRVHPRLLFPARTLDQVRATLSTTRAEAFASLKRIADEALDLEPPPEPDYDRITDDHRRRIAYFNAFHAMRRAHDQGMRHLALMYVLAGDPKYGDAAKRLLLAAAEWNPDGISSIAAPYGDEIGLGLARTAAETFDWIHDRLDAAECAQVESMLHARAEQMLRRLLRLDYLYKPANSHAGRLPGYLLEHAIALAERPRATAWANFAVRAIRTSFPHWSDSDGGWSQGVAYGFSYNTTYLIPYHAWLNATGQDLWQREYYDRLPWFYLYCASPFGEVMPFGDDEHAPVIRAGQARSLMHYHGLRLRNSRVHAWSRLAAHHELPSPPLNPLPGLLLEDQIDVDEQTRKPLPHDRLFSGIGWVALHGNINDPARDLLVLLRSSPHGPSGHAHASQNDIAILKGGRALLGAGGLRFPFHDSPFHVEYARQTSAHNCVLVNGEGQSRTAGSGVIAAFTTADRHGYACGDATNPYEGRLLRWHRHIALLRPAVILLVDDLAAPEPSTFEWLLHSLEPFVLDDTAKSVSVSRLGASLSMQIFASTSFSMQQTDAWPIAPDSGFPGLEIALPERRWHFTARTNRPVSRLRIAAVMVCTMPDDPQRALSIEPDDGVVQVAAGELRATINLADGHPLQIA